MLKGKLKEFFTSAPEIDNELTNISGTLFFVSVSPFGKKQLWTSDGTSGGTSLLKEFATSNPEVSNELLEFNQL
ncbi:MAG: hypothetical protein HRT71_18605 [Flavobacteriales bacterium]|nr:hypothetical protein [Flavobacteriales bacterium]